ncbi:MAG TPA: cupin domain-containing protein [Gemmatimonadales bacterium]|jgi:mannose-1-phosphate guanylyltransferase|nr:cupin domain-containing protein [Gemmatimonadales bacterium]
MSEHFLTPASSATFHAAKHTKAELARGEHLFVGLNCFEPGQGQAVHTHADADKFYLVLSGNARMIVGDETRDAGVGTLVWAPRGIPHGVEHASERTVMLVGIAPPPPP